MDVSDRVYTVGPYTARRHAEVDGPIWTVVDLVQGSSYVGYSRVLMGVIVFYLSLNYSWVSLHELELSWVLRGSMMGILAKVLVRYGG